MAFLLDWVKQIFAICIFTGLLMHLVPGDKYRSYISFAGSVILILVCVSPVITLITGEDRLKDMLLDFNMHFQEESIKNYGGMGLLTDGEEEKNYYESLVIEYIESKVLEHGYYPVSTEVVIDWDTVSDTYGTLQKITLKVAKEKQRESHINIDIIGDAVPELADFSELKSQLAEYYGINPFNVNIYEG